MDSWRSWVFEGSNGGLHRVLNRETERDFQNTRQFVAPWTIANHTNPGMVDDGQSCACGPNFRTRSFFPFKTLPLFAETFAFDNFVYISFKIIFDTFGYLFGGALFDRCICAGLPNSGGLHAAVYIDRRMITILFNGTSRMPPNWAMSGRPHAWQD